MGCVLPKHVGLVLLYRSQRKPAMCRVALITFMDVDAYRSEQGYLKLRTFTHGVLICGGLLQFVFAIVDARVGQEEAIQQTGSGAVSACV